MALLIDFDIPLKKLYFDIFNVYGALKMTEIERKKK